MDEPPTPPLAGPNDYGAPEVLEGQMLTPAGLEDCLGDDDDIGEHTTPGEIPLGQMNDAQVDGGEDEGWQLWEGPRCPGRPTGRLCHHEIKGP